MIIVSRNSKSRMFHDTKKCSCYKRIKPENQIVIKNIHIASCKGYYPCTKSNNLLCDYKKKENLYEFLLEEYDLSMIVFKGRLYIYTNTSEWKIVNNNEPHKSQGRKYLLYHVNHCSRDYKVRNPYEIESEDEIDNNVGYHLQNTLGIYTLKGLLLYIEDHDHWRESKEKRKERNEDKKKGGKFRRGSKRADRRKPEKRNKQILFDED